MNNYNEKQNILNQEIRKQREQAQAQFFAARNALQDEFQKAGAMYDDHKKELQAELDELLAERLILKRDGLTITNEKYAHNLQREKEINSQQYNAKMAFFDVRRTYGKQLETATEQYRAEKSRIDDYKAERLLQIERERAELKERANEPELLCGI